MAWNRKVVLQYNQLNTFVKITLKLLIYLLKKQLNKFQVFLPNVFCIYKNIEIQVFKLFYWRFVFLQTGLAFDLNWHESDSNVQFFSLCKTSLKERRRDRNNIFYEERGSEMKLELERNLFVKL